MEPTDSSDTGSIPLIFLNSFINPDWGGADLATVLIASVFIILFLVCSAAFSGSENAFFSLPKNTLNEIKLEDSKSSKAITYLLSHHKKLLAVILISNNFVNVGIVLLSGIIFDLVFNFSAFPILGFIIQVVLVTFLLVLLGEIMPKIYATLNAEKIARFMAIPLLSLSKILAWPVYLLENSTSIIDKRIAKKGHMVSVDELNHAIEITTNEQASQEEKGILKGIVNFGNIDVKQIMTPRLEIAAFEAHTPFKDLVKKISEWNYSRLPIYSETIDSIKGVLSVKDILPVYKDENKSWSEYIRPAYFVPETKKIDDLFKEFQEKRVHLAIVVDEFGGTLGIVTMEDILEEIFGEIHDEFDEEQNSYSRLDEYTWVFEGKILLNDLCRLMEIEPDTFDEVKGEADTLGGLVVEMAGNIPNLGAQLQFESFKFLVEGVDKRRVKRVKVQRLIKNDENDE